MSQLQPSIYVSHAWGGESEALVMKIVKRFKKEGLPITLDKQDLGYRESISAFMQSLGKADAIILVISDKYLHSEYCMFELLQIYENKNIMERIFPVVLDEVKIAKSTDRLELVKYWESETIALEDKIRELRSLSNIEGITEDLNLYNSIRANIAKLTGILKDINTLNIRLHESDDFDQLVNAVRYKIVKNTALTQPDIPDTAVPKQPTPEVATDRTQGKLKGFFALLLIPLFGAVWWGYTLIYQQVPSTESALIALEIPDTLTNREKVNTNELIGKSKIDIASTKLSPTVADSVESTLKVPIESTKSQLSTVAPRRVAERKPKPDETPSVVTPSSSAPLAAKDPEAVSKVDSKYVHTSPAESAVAIEVVEKKKQSLTVPETYLAASFIDDVSSDQVLVGDIIYLNTLSPVEVGPYTVIAQGARVKATVVTASSSLSGSRGALALRFEGVETVDGQWVEINYPVYSQKGRGEIIFEKGNTLNKLKLKNTTLSIAL